jgi:hypothetical protein
VVAASVRWLPVALVVALLGAGMVAAASGELSVAFGPPPPPGTEEALPLLPTEERLPPEQGDAGPADAGPGLPAWVGALFGGLCVATIVGLLLALVWATLRERLARRRVVPDVADPEELRRLSQERVRAAVDEGLADLDVADADPRRAVIACWVRLEKAAAAAGTPREPGDTSTELVQRLLAGHAVTAPVLAGLAEVYRLARFGTDVVDETMRDRARSALLQLRDELSSRVTAGGSSPEEPR